MQILGKLKVLTLWAALFGLFLMAPLSSCGKKKEKTEAESQEHPSEDEEHPNEDEEHPD